MSTSAWPQIDTRIQVVPTGKKLPPLTVKNAGQPPLRVVTRTDVSEALDRVIEALAGVSEDEVPTVLAAAGASRARPSVPQAAMDAAAEPWKHPLHRLRGGVGIPPHSSPAGARAARTAISQLMSERLRMRPTRDHKPPAGYHLFTNSLSRRMCALLAPPGRFRGRLLFA